MITFVSKGQSQSIGIFTQLTMKYFYVNSSVNVSFYVNFSWHAQIDSSIELFIPILLNVEFSFAWLYN